MTNDEQAAFEVFEQSQRNRRRVEVIFGVAVIALFAGLRGYQVWLRHEANKPVVIDTRPTHAKLGLTADEYEAQLQAEADRLKRQQR